MSKFKNTEELEKAYKELEREFTKKSQKLALYEKTNYVTLLNKEMDSLIDDYAKRRISDLEAKLAESEKNVELYKKEKCLARPDSKPFVRLEDYQRLEQQLAEKELELERVKDIHIYDKTIEIFTKALAMKNQDKISFAIAELEKVKEHNDNLVCDDEDYYNYITAFIDNKIASLKKGVE